MSRRGSSSAAPIGTIRATSEVDCGVDASTRRRIELGGIAASVDEVRETGTPRRTHVSQSLRAQRLG